MLSTSLSNLLSWTDPKISVFNEGNALFSLMLTDEDYLSATPLEAAYIWSLSSKSALGGGLKFPHSYFTIKCKKLLSARLFPGGNSSLCDSSFLKKDILYYADERNGKPTHPLAYIFFITKDKQLVLVDVTGGNDNNMLLTNKRKNLVDWINVNGGRMMYNERLLLAWSGLGSSC